MTMGADMDESHESDQERAEAEEEAPSYELSLTGRGMTIKRTVDENVALGVLTLAMGGAPPEPGARSVPSHLGQRTAGVTPPEIDQTAHSIGEFLNEVKAKRNP